MLLRQTFLAGFIFTIIWTGSTDESSALAQPAANDDPILEEGANLQESVLIESPYEEQPISPDDLKPANLLDRPTQPEEVKIQQEISISLQQAIKLVEQNSQQLQVALLRLDQSRAQVREARSALFPTLTLQGGINRDVSASGEIAANIQADQLRQGIRDGQAQIAALEASLAEPFDLNNPQELLQFGSLSQQLQQGQSSLTEARTTLTDLENYATLQVSGSIGLNYTVFSAQRTPLIEASLQNLRFNELEVERIREQLRLDITAAYYQLQQADQQIRIEEASVRESTRSLNDSQTLTSAGLATRLDVLNSEVQLGEAVQRLASAQSQQRSARRKLAQLLNLGPTITPVAADPVERAGNWNLTLEESIVLAFNNREELEQLLVQRQIGIARQRAEIGALLPQVNLFANYNILQLDTEDPGEFSTEGFGDGYSLGASLQWNFWDGGLAEARAKQRQLDASIAEVDFSDSRNLIRLQVEQAYFDLESNNLNIQTARQVLERAEEALQIARLRFQAAVGTQADVLDAETRLTQAQGNLLQAVLGHNLALSQLQRAVGSLSQSSISNELEE